MKRSGGAFQARNGRASLRGPGGWANELSDLRSPKDNLDDVAFFTTQGFFCSDPLGQIGLIQSVTPSHVPLEIINRYENRPERVRCGVCKTDRKHNAGFTIKFSNGDLALCGRICAKRVFGSELVSRLEVEFEKRKSDSYVRLVVEPAKDACFRTHAALHGGLIESESLAARFCSALKQFGLFPEDSRRGTGEAILTFSDLAGDKTLLRAMEILAKRVKGPHEKILILGSNDIAEMGSDFRQADRQLLRIIDTLRNRDIDTKRISELNGERLELIGRIDDAWGRLREFFRYFDEDRLICLAAWLKIHFGYDSVSYSKSKKELILRDVFGGEVSISCPTSVDMTSLSSPGYLLKASGT